MVLMEIGPLFGMDQPDSMQVAIIIGCGLTKVLIIKWFNYILSIATNLPGDEGTT